MKMLFPVNYVVFIYNTTIRLFIIDVKFKYIFVKIRRIFKILLLPSS